MDVLRQILGRLLGPPLVYAGWAVVLFLLTMGGNYRAFLKAGFFLPLLLSIGVMACFAIIKLRDPAGGGSRQKSLNALVGGGLLLIPLIYLCGVWDGSLGSHAFAMRKSESLVAPAACPVDPGKKSSPGDNVENSELSVLKLIRNQGDYYGKEVVTRGSVLRSEGLAPEQVVLFRFVMSCCAADARPVWLTVEGDGETIAALKNDDWVQVRGRFGIREIKGQKVPAITAASVVPVPLPGASERFLFY